MYCINCWNQDTKVIDSRSTDEGDSIRRRRECENCNYRFTTFEKIELINLVVVKTGNKKQKYEVNIRLGRLTLLEIKACLFCTEECTAKRVRIIVFNFGFEV